MATERFHYTAPDGKSKIDLPRFNQLPMGYMRRLRKMSDADQMFGLLEMIVEDERADEEIFDVVDVLNIDEFQDFMEAWQKHGGISFPES